MPMLAQPLRLENLPRRQSRVAAHPIITLPNHIRRFKELLHAIRLTEGQTRVLASTAGDFKENQDGTFWFKPRPINEGQFSRWMNGQEAVPIWRTGQLIAIAEYVLCLRLLQIETNHPDVENLRLRDFVKFAPRHLNYFYKHEEYAPWVRIFRDAIYQRVKADRNLSAYDSLVYARLVEFLRVLGFVDKEEKSLVAGKGAEKAADDATMQTPA